MSGLFFRKDSNFDTKIRPQEDIKYDTYRLWYKDDDARDISFDIYVKIPKGESIGNLVPKLANIAPSTIKAGEKREPMLFYFDDLENSSFMIDPNINIQIDPDIELHLEDARFENVQDFAFLNGKKDKKEVYISKLELSDVSNSSVVFLEEGFKSLSKETSLDYKNVKGLHVETSNMDSLYFRDITTYDHNSDFFCANNRKIVVTSPTIRRSSFSVVATEFEFKSDKGEKDTSVIFNVKSGMINDSFVGFSFHDRDTIHLGEGTNLGIDKANVFLEDTKVTGPSNGTLFIKTYNDKNSETPDFYFKDTVEMTSVTTHNIDKEHSNISLEEKGYYKNARIAYYKDMTLRAVEMVNGDLRANIDKPLSMNESNIIESSLCDPKNGDKDKVFISKTYLNSVTLNRPDFIYDYKQETPNLNNSSIFVTGEGFSSTRYFENCKFNTKNKGEQNILVKGQTATVIKNALFEGAVKVEVADVPSIDSTIFNGTETFLSSSKGFNRCEFSGRNKLKLIPDEVTNSVFNNVKCNNVKDLSFNYLDGFTGENMSYSQVTDSLSDKSKNNESLDIL